MEKAAETAVFSQREVEEESAFLVLSGGDSLEDPKSDQDSMYGDFID